MRLEHQVAVVTGAGSGIGRALANRIAARGAYVVVAGRTVATLATVEAEILAAGGSCICVPCDATISADRLLLCRAMSDRFGRIDLLVNNAGMFLAGPIGSLTDDQLQRLVTVNVHAPIALTQDSLSLLRASLNPRVVNVGSVFGDIGHPMFTAYCASKFAVWRFSDALRRELLPEGIGVTYVAPRATRTEGASAFGHLIDPFGMAVDSPETAAASIMLAIERGSRSRYAAGWERLFVWLQRLAPSLVDAGLAHKMAKYLSRP